MQKNAVLSALTDKLNFSILNLHLVIHCRMQILYVIKFPRSRGVSGALYLQSAIAGVLSRFGFVVGKLPLMMGVDVLVLRNRNLRTVSGRERSSTKQNLLCAVR